MNKTLVIILIIVAILACVVFGFLSRGISVYNEFVLRQNQIGEAKSNFDVAVTFMTQKIEAVYKIMQSAFDAETLLQTGIAEKRSGYQEAVEGGNPAEIAEAAAAFAINFNAVAENPPVTGFADLATGTQREVAEAYNQLTTALVDVNTVTRRYNEYRQKLVLPKIVGGIGGFPESYEYYETTKEIPQSFEDIVN